MDVPQWPHDLSPLLHVPQLPGHALTLAPIVWLTLIAAVGLAVALLAFRRRDP